MLMTIGPLKNILGLTLLLVAGGLQASPLNQWTWRFPDPQGYTLAAVTYGGGQFVAAGDNGTIITSPDGYNWTVRSYGVFPYLRGVAYADGEYAAVGDGGVILVSSNAATWTQLPSLTTNSLHGIAGDSAWRSDGLPQFIAVGDSGTAIECSNSTNWVTASSGTTNSLYAVQKSSSTLYLIVGDAGTVIRLTAVGFTPRPEDFVGTTCNLYAVASAGNGIVAAAGDLTPNPYFYPTQYAYTNAILYSLNSGIRWTNEQWILDEYGNNPNLWHLSEFFILTGMTYGSNGFVAVGDTGISPLDGVWPSVIFTSTDGQHWLETSPYISENSLNAATYGNGLYVLVGDAGIIIVSSNLVNWTEIAGCHRSAISAIACNSNLCIASAQPIYHDSFNFADFTTLVSTDGVSWAVSTTNMPDMADLTSGGGQFVGISQNNIYTTTDGYNWQNSDSFSNTLHGVCFVNGQFIAVGDNGGILESADGTNWSNQSVATSGSLSGIAFGNGIYVAAGSIAATSSDSISWSLCPSNPPAVIRQIVFGKGLFVAAANGGTLTSQDGIHWQVASSYTFLRIAYSGGTFLAIGFDGVIYESLDGTNWINTAFRLPTVDYYWFLYYGKYYASVCAYKGTFLAASVDGVMFQSGNAWNQAMINAPQSTPGYSGNVVATRAETFS